jgi:hypothetical protein
MSDNHRTACDWAPGIENFAAEFTRAFYPFVLRRGPRDSWLKVESAMPTALAMTPTADAARPRCWPSHRCHCRHKSEPRSHGKHSSKHD